MAYKSKRGYNKSKSTKGRRRTYKPRKRYLPLGGLPEKQTVRLKFSEYTAIDPTVGANAPIIYRANSIYDPNYTSVTGTQPTGYDTWKELYNHYTVIGAKIKYRVFNSTSNAVWVNTRLSANPTYLSDPVDITNQKYSKTKFCKPTDGYVTVVQTFNNRFLRAKKAALQNEELTPEFGYNPVEQGYFILQVNGVDPAKEIDPLPVQVEIEYICVLSEPKYLN